MNKLERFGLFTGIIGLLSDTIALITFMAGFWGSPTKTAVAVPATTHAAGTTIEVTGYEIPLVIRAILIFFLIYSWAAISWVLVRRSFRLRKHRKPAIIADIVFRSVVGIGILVLPIFAMWTITYWQSGVPSRAEGDKVYAEFQARNPKIVRKGFAVNDPSAVEDMCTDTDPKAANCIWDQSDAAFWALIISIPLQGFLAGAVYLLFVLLIPVVYPDMSAEEIAYELGLTPEPTLAETTGVNEAVAKILPLRSTAKTK